MGGVRSHMPTRLRSLIAQTPQQNGLLCKSALHVAITPTAATSGHFSLSVSITSPCTTSSLMYTGHITQHCTTLFVVVRMSLPLQEEPTSMQSVSTWPFLVVSMIRLRYSRGAYLATR